MSDDDSEMTSASTEPLNLSLFTILVVEDNHDDYLLLDHAFKKAEFSGRRKHARDGLEAKAYLSGEGTFANRQANPLPVLIIADLKMPRMNGIELLAWTRKQPVIKRIPFVMLSSSGSPRDVTAAYESFANSYHVKPSRLEDLILLLKYLRTYWFKASARPEVPENYVASGHPDCE